MSDLRFRGQTYDRRKEESVLQTLTRHGVSIPHSCKSGVCQSCMMRAVSGDLPKQAQKDLKPTLVEQNYFLACCCYPDAGLEIALADEDVSPHIPAKVISKEALNSTVMRLRLAPSVPFNYRAGQFVNLYRNSDITRSYSLASVPGVDNFLEFHVKLVPGGAVSEWIHNTLEVGTTIMISEAKGNSFYVPGKPEQPLLLIGTGTGLAPLYGVLRDAIQQGHDGPVYLYHGNSHAEDLYLRDELSRLSADIDHFHYVPCVSRDDEGNGLTSGRAHTVAFAQHPDLKGWRVFLCGNPGMVDQARRNAFLAGAGFSDILVDPFKFASG